MKNVIKVLIIGLLASVSSMVSAATISTLGVSGNFGYDAATEIVSLSTVGSNGVADGIFTGTIDSTPGTGGSVDLTATDFVSVPTFFTKNSWTFDLETLDYVSGTSPATLDFGGTGFITSSTDSVKHTVNWTFTASDATTYSMNVTTVVPVPAAVWLFGTGLIGLVGVARRKV